MKQNLICTNIILLFALIFNSSALNILGIFPYHGKSHFFVHRVYLRELANRGHNVTVISCFPEKEPTPNYHDISLPVPEKELSSSVERSYWTVIEASFYLTTTGRENCKTMLANQEVHNLIKRKSKFDVIVVEQFNSDCALGIAYKLNAPVVGINSHILMPWHYNRLGIPYNPSFVPFHFLGGGTKPTLYQRIERQLFDIYFRILYYFATQRRDQNTLAQYYDDIPPLEDLAREIKFLLIYQNFVLTGSRLFPANVIEVGGYHVTNAKPLTGELKSFVEGAEHGVIYISFGTVLDSTTLSAEQVKALLDAMDEFPQRFVWKWDNKSKLLSKDKLFTSNWLPQVDILGHPKTLAFFSHCGNGGTTEAIHFGVPMIAMPILGDQPANAAAIEESGLGVQIDVNHLTKKNVVAVFKAVLDSRFRENVKRVTKAWHDRPLSPMDMAIYWTEYAARHSNFTFRTAAADVPLYQYIHLDILCVFAVVILQILFVTSFLIRVCYNYKSKNTSQNMSTKKLRPKRE